MNEHSERKTIASLHIKKAEMNKTAHKVEQNDGIEPPSGTQNNNTKLSITYTNTSGGGICWKIHIGAINPYRTNVENRVSS